MFDMSWGEVLVIGGVALIVIGPKDLPRALRTVGQMTSKVRRMASEFQSQFNEAMREAELDDVRREVADLNRQVSSATSFNPIQSIRDEFKGPVVPPPVANDSASAIDPLEAALPPPLPEIEPLSLPAVDPAPSASDETGPGMEGDSEIRSSPAALKSGTA